MRLWHCHVVIFVDLCDARHHTIHCISFIVGGLHGPCSTYRDRWSWYQVYFVFIFEVSMWSIECIFGVRHMSHIWSVACNCVSHTPFWKSDTSLVWRSLRLWIELTQLRTSIAVSSVFACIVYCQTSVIHDSTKPPDMLHATVAQTRVGQLWQQPVWGSWDAVFFIYGLFRCHLQGFNLAGHLICWNI